MKLAAARVFVHQLTEARAFYRAIGLAEEFCDEQHGVCVFDTGDSKFILERLSSTASAQEQSPVGRMTGLSFEVKDMQKSCQLLVENGVALVHSPEKQYWGAWIATISDPDNNEVQLVQLPF